ncbi:ABC transporter permease [Anaerocolumna cellulosilytica]|uniref:ABC transporter permease n=1 Tax=Anaerocolumna cellulosilytica TaxID=433286 RepID=A0A6S6QYN6_9FIRM|nr:ABC transporter permease subunit [Anaerocolumna cellulosilytica]MBB5193909.1 arabinogalactan oligomer/maltooligosaccharide transport system permease protein [Anaerocolumna cellulosilytica]BCJ94876.1 ABC transporter permease [Anaerocolumna cellulosilytica]
MKKYRMKKTIGYIALNIVFILLCLAGLIPILYAISLAFSKSGSALSSGLFLLPKNPTLENFRKILFEEPFFVWLKNSVILSVGTMVIAMTVSVEAAYAFSRFRFRGRRSALKMLLLLNAFPQILSMFAIFRLYKIMHLLNLHLGLILIYAGSMCIFGIWNMKGYFDTIPIEIEEASKIDGAGNLKMLVKIILPLARPAIIVTSVMVIIFVWNEYLFATTFMLQENSYSLAGGLYQLQADDYGRNWSIFSAAAILVSVPVLIIFFCIQKYMVSGLTAGGVKG